MVFRAEYLWFKKNGVNANLIYYELWITLVYIDFAGLQSSLSFNITTHLKCERRN